MGKPLGMGAVKIRPSLFISNRGERYCRLFAENRKWYEAMERIDDFGEFTQAFEIFILKQLAECVGEKNSSVGEIFKEIFPGFFNQQSCLSCKTFDS